MTDVHPVAAIIREVLLDIMRKHGRLTSEVLVEDARDPRHPLHDLFDWSDVND